MDRKPINLAAKFSRFSAGSMTIHFRDGDVAVGAGEMFVIPRGVEHKTSAKAECQAMLVETAGTINTGEVVSEKTAATDAWI